MKHVTKQRSRLALSLGALLSLAAGQGTADAQTLPVKFAAPSNFSMNTYCQEYCSISGAAVGDFNGDGIPDVVSISSQPWLSVALGNGDGTFQAPTSMTANSGAGAIAVGDFNGDGKLDVALWGNTNGSMQVQIYLGDGHGGLTYSNTYVAPNSNSFGPTTADLVVADVNGDGKLDIIGNTPYNGVFVFPGNGDGTFGSATNYGAGVGGSAGVAIAAGDLNGDGKPDLAVSINYGMSVLLNNGDGTFGAPTYYNTSVNGYSGAANAGIAIADLNHDGRNDVIATNFNGVFAFLNEGNGQFSVNDTGAPGGTQVLAVGDFNGDGKPDFAVSGGAYVFTYLGDGKGKFTAGPGLPNTSTQGTQSAVNVSLADFNRDGATDVLFVTNDSFGTVTLGRGDGTFQGDAFSYWGEINSGRNIVAADFNGDGVPDVAFSYVGVNTGNYPASFGVQFGKGHGVLGAPIFVNASPCNSSPTLTVATGDVNGDHKADIVATLAASGCATNMVSVVTGKGNGKFNKPAYYPTGATAQEGQVYLADINGDGKLDIVTENADGTISVLLNNGHGTYKPGLLTSSIAALDPHDLSLAIGDFTGDGKPDIAATTFDRQNVLYVLPGNGDGTFGAPIQYVTSGYAPYTVAAGDFNNDGKLDLLVTLDSGTDENCPRYTQGYAVLIGLGNGSFSQGATACGFLNGYADAPVIADFNGDGKLDAVISYGDEEGNLPPSGPTVLQGNGDGTFNVLPTPLFVGNVSAGAAVADFNGDGLPDIAVLDNNNFYGQNGDYATFTTILPNTGLPLSISPLAVNYTTVKLGSKKVETVVLTNNQTTSMPISGISVGGANAGDFSETNTCRAKLKPGLNCTAKVTFRPTTTGTSNATLLISDGLGNQTVTLTGVGK